eukprot:CCRYP_011307-RA/>CCRYP_011307-RA protein AED:0.07 eAED:0.07 QI:87/0.5/0.66/1/0.5/0.33/3/952/2100
MGHVLLVARITLLLSLSPLAAEAFVTPHSRAIVTTSHTAPQPVVASYNCDTPNKSNRHPECQRFKSYNNDDNTGGTVDKERKEKYLSLAEQAWTQFFAKDDSKPSSSNSNSVDSSRTGDNKEEYFKMALDAWDSASSNNYYADGDAVVENIVSTVDNAANIHQPEAQGNKSTNQDATTGDANLRLDSAASRMWDATSSLIDRIWGGNTASDTMNDNSKETTVATTSGGSTMESFREEDESIPYGLRAKAASNTNTESLEANTSNASNKSYFTTNGNLKTNYGMRSSPNTKSTKNDFESSSSPVMKGITAKQQGNIGNSVDSPSMLVPKGKEDTAESVSTINRMGIEWQKNKRTVGPSDSFQVEALKKQSKSGITSAVMNKSNNLGAGIALESRDGGDDITENTALDDADLDSLNNLEVEKENKSINDELNDIVDTDTTSQPNAPDKLKIDKTKLIGMGARESILTSGLRSQKGKLPKITSFSVNDAAIESKSPSSTGTSNLRTDIPTALKGVSSEKYAMPAKQSNENSFSSSFKSPKGAASPSEKQLLARSFLNSLKTPKVSGEAVEEKSDNVNGSSGAVSEAPISTSSKEDSPNVASLNKGLPKVSTPLTKQSASGNTFLSSLNTPKGSPAPKQLIARSYLNSLKAPVQKRNNVSEAQSEIANGRSSSASKFGVGSTSSPGVKSPLKGSNPSIKASSEINKVGVASSFSQKENVGTGNKIDGNSLPISSDSGEVVSAPKSEQFLKGFMSKMTPNNFFHPSPISKGKESITIESDSDIAVGKGIKSVVAAKAGFGIGDAKSQTKTTVGPPVIKRKMKASSISGTLGSVKAKTPFGGDGLKMKMSGPPGIETVALNRQTEDSGTNFLQGLKGSDSAEMKPPYGPNGLKMKIGGRSPTNSLPFLNASRTSFTAGLKRSALDNVKSPPGTAGPKIKMRNPLPDKTATNAQPFGGTVGSDFSVVKSTNVDRLRMPKLKGYVPKQNSFDSLSARSWSNFKDSVGTIKGATPVAKVFSGDSDFGALPSLEGNDALASRSGFEANVAAASANEPFLKDDNEVQDIEDSSHSQTFVPSTYETSSAFTSDANQEVFEVTEDLTPDLDRVEEGEGEEIFDDADPNDFTVLLRNIDATSLPLLRVGARVHSSVFGATHQGYLVIAKDNDGAGYNILPCTAKRPWTMGELKSNVVAEVATGIERLEPLEDWEVQMNAGTVRNYFEVEYHCYQKFNQMKELRILRRRQAEADRANNSDAQTENDAAPGSIDVLDMAVPKFLGIYQDDGNDVNEGDQDVWGKPLDGSYEWMVYSGGGIEGIQASLDQHVAVNQNDPHHLFGVQKALNLPEWFRFGDVMDVLMRSMLENLVFLTSCNVVHRDIKLSNINCDSENKRLQLINFGGAVDLDPNEGKRVGLNTQSSNTATPGSIANSFAADSFSTAMVLCQLLFNLMDDASVKHFQEQIKGASYDLDAWLKDQLENSGNEYSPEDIPALEYLGERRGAWGLLKRLIQPNPLQRKLAVNSFTRHKEIMGLRDGILQWTDDLIVKVATEEAYLETLIDRFGQDLKDLDVISNNSESNVDSDDAPYYAPIDSTQRISKEQTIVTEVPGDLKDEQATSSGAPVNPTPLRKAANRDVYYDITRSKLTSKFPPSRPSMLSSLLSPGIRSVSPPATATEIAAQQNMKVYDITRASLGVANPSTVPVNKDSKQPAKEFIENKEVPSSGRDDVVSKSSPTFTKTAIPTHESKKVSLEKSEEVGRWILSYLPRLQKQDLQFYATCLIADGFDSYDMLKELDVDDLDFMKKGHRRVLVRKLEVERKLDSELDPSSRKRIEQLLVEASSKKISNKADSGVSDPSFTLPQREGQAKELVTYQSKTTQEATFYVAVAQAVSNNTATVDIPESIPLAYDIFEAEAELEEAKNRLSGKSWSADNRRLDRLDLNGKSSNAALCEQNKTKITSQSTSALAYDIIQAGEEMEQAEAWIEEQNRLVKMRRIARSTPQLTNNQLPGEMPNDSNPTSRKIDSKDDRNSTASADKYENIPIAVNFVENFSSNVDIVQSSFSDEASEDDRSAWYKEQNLLKRRLARIEEERRLREMTAEELGLRHGSKNRIG